MFRIKKRNVEAFVAYDEWAFEERLKQRLRHNFDHLQNAREDELGQLVRRGRDRAARYGIRSHYGISVYVGIMAELGEDFDESGSYPWATAVLGHVNLTGNEKVDYICDRVIELKSAGDRRG